MTESFMTGRRRFVLLMVSILTLGILNAGIGGLSHLEVVATIGEALIVAGVLGLTVDPYLKQRLAAEGFEAALRAAHGRHLPLGIQKAIASLGSCNLVRYGFEVTFAFARHSRDTVAVSTTIEFEVRNLGDSTDVFEHTITLYKLPLELPAKPRAIVARCSGLAAVQYEYRENDILLTETDEFWRWAKPVEIPPGKSVFFSGETHRVLPAKWIDIFYFSHPTVGAKVRSFAPDGSEVTVTFAHEAKVETQVHPSRAWELRDAAFLPYMSFVARWSVPTDDVSDSPVPV